jgi:hypothetical protein
MAKLTAADLDKMAGFDSYEAPEPRDKPKVVAEFDNQKKAAEFVKDMLKVVGQGASLGFADEGIAAAKTGSISSPEYINERNIIRNEMQKSRENVGTISPVLEAAGSMIPTAGAGAISSSVKAAPVLAEMVSAGIQGAGESEDITGIPGEMGTSMALQGAAEVAGKGLKKLISEDSTKILSKSMGAKASQVNLPEGKSIKESIKRLNDRGFFKQGEVVVDTTNQAYKRAGKTLGDFFKPQSLDSLYERSIKSLSTLKEANNALLENKYIKRSHLIEDLNQAVADMTYDPTGFNVSARENLAEEVKNIILEDLVAKGNWLPQQNFKAKAIEEAKKSLDAHIGTPAFKKRAEDLGINPEAMMLFRKKLDSLVDQVGGKAYKLNNDMMSDLINVKQTIENKLNRSYVDTGSGLIDQRSWMTKLLEGISPTPVDIARSDLATAAENPLMQGAGKLLKRTPVEALTEDKGGYPTQEPANGFNGVKPAFPFGVPPQEQIKKLPGSSMITPREIINFRIPRTTDGILANKERVIAKLVQNGVDGEMIDTIAQALNDDLEAVSNIAPLIIQQFPTIFERSKYQVFDGVIAGPDRAKAADAISKRADMDSIARAKAIDGINKYGKLPQELA